MISPARMKSFNNPPLMGMNAHNTPSLYTLLVLTVWNKSVGVVIKKLNASINYDWCFWHNNSFWFSLNWRYFIANRNDINSILGSEQWLAPTKIIHVYIWKWCSVPPDYIRNSCTLLLTACTFICLFRSRWIHFPVEFFGVCAVV